MSRSSAKIVSRRCSTGTIINIEYKHTEDSEEEETANGDEVRLDENRRREKGRHVHVDTFPSELCAKQTNTNQEGLCQKANDMDTSTHRPSSSVNTLSLPTRNVIIGKEQRAFRDSELLSLHYFKRLLTKNKKADSLDLEIKIDDQAPPENRFGIKELQTIIECKQYSEILDYDFCHISRLLHAVQYFKETIKSEIFYQYFLHYFPVIDPVEAAQSIQYDIAKNPEFAKAFTDYKSAYHYLGSNITTKFINYWRMLPIHILSNMSNVSYLVLMKTMKLLKVERDSRFRDPSEEWFHRDCVLYIELIKYRSWADFEMLWKSVLKSDNYAHLLNVISSVITQYLHRPELERWEAGDQYGCDNEYKHIERPHDIGHVCKQMIKRVAYRIFYDKRDIPSAIYSRFQQIIKKYLDAAVMMNESQNLRLYEKLVAKYFVTKKAFHPSIIILFHDSYFDGLVFQQEYMKLSKEERTSLLHSVFTSSTMQQHQDEYQKVYAYFMQNNKLEAFQYIKSLFLSIKLTAIKPSFVSLVITFQDMLKMENEKQLLQELHALFKKDLHLLQTAKTDNIATLLTLMCNVCDEKTVSKRFDELCKLEQILFLKHLFKPCEIADIARAQKELAQYLLDKHMNIAVEIFDVWFPVLMIEKLEWINNTFLNPKLLSFVELEKTLNVISEMLLTDNSGCAPQVYYDFVNKYANVDL